MIIPTPLVPVADDPYHVLLEALTRIDADPANDNDNERLHVQTDKAVWVFLRAVHPAAAAIIDQWQENFWYA